MALQKGAGSTGTCRTWAEEGCGQGDAQACCGDNGAGRLEGSEAMPGVPAGTAPSLLIPWHRNMLAGKELAVPPVGMLFPTPWRERVSGLPLLCAHGMGLSHPGIRTHPCQPPRVCPQGL